MAAVQVKRSDLRKRENTAINLYICCYASKLEIGRLKYKLRYPLQKEVKGRRSQSRRPAIMAVFFFFLGSRAPGSPESAGLDNETVAHVTRRRSPNNEPLSRPQGQPPTSKHRVVGCGVRRDAQWSADKARRLRTQDEISTAPTPPPT